MAHAKLSPSAAKQWLTCPGSIRMQAGLPDKTSVFALEGSAAHQLAEWCLIDPRLTPESVLDSYICREPDGSWSIKPEAEAKTESYRGKAFCVNYDMADAVGKYLTHCRSKWVKGAEIRVEQKVKITEDVWGTPDHVCGVPFDTLHVDDYKHGRGVPVSPEWNPQPMIYALGAMYSSAYDYERIVVSIVQPRGKGAAGNGIKTWTVTPRELYHWRDTVLLPGIEATRAENAPLKAGDHCRFCRAKAQCPEMSQLTLRTTQAVFSGVGKDEITLPDPRHMSQDQIAEMASMIPILRSYFDDVEAHMHDLMVNKGVHIEGFKVVPGKAGARRWENESAALQIAAPLLGDEAFTPRKVRTPTQIEAALKKAGYKPAQIKEIFAGHVVKPQGKPTVTPETDKRKALGGPAQRAFANIG